MTIFAKIRKRLGIIVVLVLAFMPVGLTLVMPNTTSASITNTRADSAGTVELSGSGWLGGSGVDVYSNGNSATNTWGNNYVGPVLAGSKWQCVEMVNRLYLAKGWMGSHWTGNGNTLVDHVPAGLAKQTNGAISYLNPGDVITLDDGGDGHAAIIDSISGNTIQIVNQNTTAVYSTAYISTGSLSGGNATLHMNGWSNYSIQAVIHHPITVSQPAAQKILSAIRTDGILVSKDGINGGWIAETGNVAQTYASGNYIGALLTDGTFLVKDGVEGAWVVETGNVAQVAMSGTRIAVVLTDGTLMAKDGINGGWNVLYGNVVKTYLGGTYIGALLTNGNLVVREGMSGAWVTEMGNVSEAYLASNYIGTLLTNGDFYVKEGINGGWVNLMGNVTKAAIGENKRIAVILTNGNLVAKDTINGGWNTLYGNVVDVKLGGTYIGARLTNNDLVVREGMSGAWVTETGNVDKFYMSDTRIGAILTDGTLMAKDGINGGWNVETGNVVSATFN